MSQLIETVQKRFAFSEKELMNYANTAPFRYKTYRIKKRSGGTREISQPSRDLKILQRFILAEFFHPKFIYHDCATAYRENKNIADNARPHMNSPYLLKMDFKDFFPSIRANDFQLFLPEKGICETGPEADILAKLFFKHTEHGLALSIGAPGSPSISNAMLFDFDQTVSGLSEKLGITYTRYSDDLSFSTDKKNLLFGLPKTICRVLEKLKYPKLALNAKKTVFSSRKFNRHITGITISNEGKLSIGHSRKRKLRARVYSAAGLEGDDLARLRGYISFVNQIEPDLIRKLLKRYPSQMKLINSASFRKDTQSRN